MWSRPPAAHSLLAPHSVEDSTPLIAEDHILPEQKKKLLKAKIAVALHDELGRVPKKEEIEQVFLMARVMYKAVLGLHFQRQQQKKNGQLAIF